MAGPMEQFEVKVLRPFQMGTYDLSFTNSALWMAIALAGISVFLSWAPPARSWSPAAGRPPSNISMISCERCSTTMSGRKAAASRL